MPGVIPRIAGIAFLVLCSAWAVPASACDVPVFRYALERWPADPYQLIVFADGPLEAEHEQLVSQLTLPGSPANVAPRTVDINALEDPALEHIWAGQQDTTLPWLVMLYPTAAPSRAVLWSGPLTTTSIRRILDSPARQAIAQRLVDGESAVWAFLESGDTQQDRTLYEQLEGHLKIQADTLELPGETDDAIPDVDESLLRIAFSPISVSRANPEEAVFVQMLLGTEPDLASIDDPMAFPIYGRGRALYALVGAGINEENIHAACAFVVGSCSCQVKEDNPGIDMLMAKDWDGSITSLLGGNDLPEELPSPALMQAAASPDSPSAQESPVEPTSELGEQTAATPQPRGVGSGLRNLGAIVIVSVLGIGVASFLMIRRRQITP